ncbi:MAG: 30S ribosomal protein S19e [Candidatus Helarchaeota archaeon]|nr:30S ribosomal protein S19e [Candidatus Helarchaeota archaeon]
MTTVYDVPPKILIDELAEILKKDYEQVTPLDWVSAVKAGVHKENPPQTKDWWYIRCASILRKLYILNLVGINKLRNIYGGRKRRGPKPNVFRRSSGSIIRKALQQLESAGLVEIIEKKGRKLTSNGQSLLDRTALKIKMRLQKGEIPGLVKY